MLFSTDSTLVMPWTTSHPLGHSDPFRMRPNWTWGSLRSQDFPVGCFELEFRANQKRGFFWLMFGAPVDIARIDVHQPFWRLSLQFLAQFAHFGFLTPLLANIKPCVIWLSCPSGTSFARPQASPKAEACCLRRRLMMKSASGRMRMPRRTGSPPSSPGAGYRATGVFGSVNSSS